MKLNVVTFAWVHMSSNEQNIDVKKSIFFVILDTFVYVVPL
jgi:hypothetical protein